MGKLINIVAVSVGSGIVLGAGLRFLDKNAEQEQPRSGGPKTTPEHEAQLLDRIHGIEQKLHRIACPAPGEEQASIAGLQLRLDAQQAETDALRASLAATQKSISQANEKTDRLGTELRTWVAEDIRKRLVEVEARLEQNVNTLRQDHLDALVEGVHVRVAERITRLEEEVAGQSAAMLELRDCSVKTEQSVQKLLEGIERLVSAQAQARGKRATDDPDAQGAELETVRAGAAPSEEKSRSRRWGLFS